MIWNHKCFCVGLSSEHCVCLFLLVNEASKYYAYSSAYGQIYLTTQEKIVSTRTMSFNRLGHYFSLVQLW